MVRVSIRVVIVIMVVECFYVQLLSFWPATCTMLLFHLMQHSLEGACDPKEAQGHHHGYASHLSGSPAPRAPQYGAEPGSSSNRCQIAGLFPLECERDIHVWHLLDCRMPGKHSEQKLYCDLCLLPIHGGPACGECGDHKGSCIPEAYSPTLRLMYRIKIRLVYE